MGSEATIMSTHSFSGVSLGRVCGCVHVGPVRLQYSVNWQTRGRRSYFSIQVRPQSLIAEKSQTLRSAAGELQIHQERGQTI